jgi:hypothetical protein
LNIIVITFIIFVQIKKEIQNALSEIQEKTLIYFSEINLQSKQQEKSLET